MINQNIIKTALLGLKTKKAGKVIFPDAVQPYLDNIQDNEELFLNGLSLTFQYRGSGDSLPVVEKLNTQVVTCPDDDKPFVSEKMLFAFDQAVGNDFIRYSIPSFIQIIAKKALNQNKILPSDRLPHVIDALLEEKLSQERKNLLEYPYRSYIPNYENLKNIIVSSFGNTGQWIFDMMNPPTQIDIEDLDAKGRRELFQKIWFENKEHALPFLEQFFAHDRLNNQKSYLQTMVLSMKMDEDIEDFFTNYFENTKGKRVEELAKFYELVQIIINPQQPKRAFFESLFIEMWQSRSLFSKELKLKQKDEIVQELAPLDDYPIVDVLNLSFSNLESKVYFLFLLIPFDRACTLLKVKSSKYLSAIVKIESLSKNKNFNPISALIPNVFKYKQLDIARQILLASNKIQHTYWELLFLFPKDEIVLFLEQNFEIVQYINNDIFAIVIKYLNCESHWSEKFTHLMLNQLLTNQSFYSSNNRFYKALWLAGPYLPKNAQQIAINVANSELHQYAWKRMEIQTYINSVMNAKVALDDI